MALRSLFSLFFATVLLAACGNDDPTGMLAQGGGGSLEGDIKASGSSAQEAAMTAWIAGYQGEQPGVLVQYDAIGSGGGRENLIAGATDIGGTDAFLDEFFNANGPLLHSVMPALNERIFHNNGVPTPIPLRQNPSSAATSSNASPPPARRPGQRLSRRRCGPTAPS